MSSSSPTDAAESRTDAEAAYLAAAAREFG